MTSAASPTAAPGTAFAVSGPDFVALQVRDLETSATFYEDVLGLTRTPQSPPDAVVFRTSPIPFAVRKPLPGVELDAASPRPGLGVALWLRCGDATALHDRLACRDVPIVAPLLDGPFGRQCTFLDPDGYAVTVHDGG